MSEKINAKLAAALQNNDKYIISAELQQAIEIAELLGQPLLLTGEPGTGKTRLARHIASKRAGGTARNLEEFFAKTTSTATDLFYRYDALQHFHYSQNAANAGKSAKDFVYYQALGRAIQSGNPDMVVLVDEIDKAPRDFPNDLLHALDEFAFEVPELGLVGNNKIKGDRDKQPFVIITSNSEKNLPDAFLRRCVYFHIKFPNEKQLLEILNNLELDNFLPSELKKLAAHFIEIRETAKRKKPATAEFLAWAAWLNEKNFPADKLLPKVDKLSEQENLSKQEKQILQASYSILLKSREDLEGAGLREG